MKYKAIKEIALKTALGYLEKDPEKNMPKLMNWVDKLAGTGPDSFESQRAAVRARLQRSPTWFFPAPNANELADTLRMLEVDESWIHEIVRRKILFDLPRASL